MGNLWLSLSRPSHKAFKGSVHRCQPLKMPVWGLPECLHPINVDVCHTDILAKSHAWKDSHFVWSPRVQFYQWSGCLQVTDSTKQTQVWHSLCQLGHFLCWTDVVIEGFGGTSGICLSHTLGAPCSVDAWWGTLVLKSRLKPTSTSILLCAQGGRVNYCRCCSWNMVMQYFNKLSPFSGNPVNTHMSLVWHVVICYLHGPLLNPSALSSPWSFLLLSFLHPTTKALGTLAESQERDEVFLQ